MAPHRYEDLRVAIRAFDEKMRVLCDYGIDMSLPGPALLADLRARRDERRRQFEELEATQREADRLLLPELFDLYCNGGDADRQQIRDLVWQCRSFRWGFGWGLVRRIANADDTSKALAVLSMKDGGSDYRDEIVALDNLCAAMRRAGLPIAALLTEAASWSSDIARFPPSRSTRALLLHYAARFDPLSP